MALSRLRRALVTCALGLAVLGLASASDHAAGSTGARTLDHADAFKLVAVGPGYVESSARQVVRTADDRVYIFAADDTAHQLGSGRGVIRAWKSNVTGIPTSFSEVDGADRPVAAGAANVLVSVDARLDRLGLVHLVYVDETTNDLIYRVFSTTTDTWGPATVIATDVDANFYIIKRSRNLATIVLDNQDQPQVVYASGTDLFERVLVGGAWTAPTRVATDSRPLHPQLAVDGTGTLHLSWLHDDGSSSSIKYARRPAGGSWAVPETVASADVQANSTGDQGPSIVLTRSGDPYILYVTPGGTSWIRIKHRTTSGWAYDNPDTDLYTHAPQIYAQNDDIYAFLGHDDQIRFGYDYRLSGQPWAGYVPLSSTADGTLDGSASVRWDPQRDTDPGVIDTAFFDEDKNDDSNFLPQLYYMAVLAGGNGTASDTKPPSVALTSPADGTTVSGTVELAASAADDVGVSGVQFELDGLPLGAADVSAPYVLSWDTSTAAPGEHVLTATAGDAAGNTAVSAPVRVTVQNASPSSSGGLLAAYAFNEGVGTTVADVSGHGHGGTLEGAKWTSEGKFGSALAFDGADSWVTVADAADLDLRDGMTLEAWVRPSALGTSWRTVLFKERSGGVVYSLYANQSTGLPVGQVYIGGEQNATGHEQLPLDTWTHLAVTFDGTSLRLYVDGTLRQTTSISGAMSGSDGPLRIGGNAIWNEWFDGLIDELRIYNRALSTAEIQTDMNTPVGSAADTLSPSAPNGVSISGATQSTVSLTWSASSDNVGVTRYSVYENGASVGSTSSTEFTVSGLACGSLYTFSVDSQDAAGNRSAQTSVAGATAPCSQVAAYAFNEGVGTTVADVSGHGHGGTLEGAKWTSEGKFGSALAFDGADSWVTVADAADLDLRDGMTLEAWVRPSALGTSWRTVLFKERSGGVVYSLYANQSTGLPVGQVYIGGEQNATGHEQLPLDTWTHLAVTFDGTSLRLYVDGTLRQTTSISGAMSGSDGPLRIGGNAIWNEWFDGLIDELRIYNRALSTAEIQTDMNTPVG